MTQQDFVEGVFAFYKANDIVPGDPEQGRWEQAHFPTPKWAGGTEVVLLLHEHHMEQGLRQSAEFGRQSFWRGDTLKWLRERWPNETGELWDLYRRVPNNQAGVVKSAETLRRMSIGRKGILHTDEAKQKMSLVGRGRKQSPEHVANKAAAQTGAKRSTETKRRMSEAQLRRRARENGEVK